MAMKTELRCPKCGSERIVWFHGGRANKRECLACGYIGEFGEQRVEDSGADIWP